ncbi:hypothetical protein OJ253_1865 [Cryptosporidium canis]|uniref:Uncharacterized protein n=1 Tax=Cryptosporidium canis TaxID=195482 RepID=A0A9D5HX61_9CRYT|nr:hypothetical protein OJ253_1865 [Cryptosporidium canis]
MGHEQPEGSPYIAASLEDQSLCPDRAGGHPPLVAGGSGRVQGVEHSPGCHLHPQARAKSLLQTGWSAEPFGGLKYQG